MTLIRLARASARLLGLAACLGLSACDRMSSTYYEGTVADWQRDSAIVDSVSRLIPTDKVYDAYRNLPFATDLRAAQQDRYCLELELEFRYGRFPARLAIQRMKDTLWRPADSAQSRAYQERARLAVPLTTECGFPKALLLSSDTMPPAVNRVYPLERPSRFRAR